MSLILNIDTTSEKAIVNIANNGEVLCQEENTIQNSHASFIHIAIKNVLKKSSLVISDIDCVAVVAGPGSYTGIRVGLATAKGICFALNKKLVLLNSLEIMAWAAADILKLEGAYYCPMIDAKRMEVFTAVYDYHIKEIAKPAAIILENSSFTYHLLNKKVIFLGSGASKWSKICDNNNATFYPELNLGKGLAKSSQNLFKENIISNIINSAPFYIKEYYINQ